jgi:hypothetical protein
MVAGVGYAWVRLGHDYPTEFVTRLGMTVASPCLIFVTLMQTQIDPAALGGLLKAAVLAHLAVGALVLALVWLLGLNRRSYAAPMIFGNTGNLGLPLALFAFGQIGLDYAVVVFAVTAILGFTVGIWLVSGGGSGQGLRLLRDPIVLGTLLGGLFLWQGWSLPPILVRPLALVGDLAIPLMLITLGVAVSRLRVRELARPLMLSVVKLAICGGAALAVAEGFGLEPVARAVLVMQMIAPVAVTSYLIALRHGADADAVAGLAVVSTALSVLSLPVALALLMG